MFDMNPNNFINSCARGELLLEEIDDFIDEWHDSESDEELHIYLGMTSEEYQLWIHQPEILSLIVTSRVQNTPIKDVIQNSYDIPMAARANSPDVAKLIMKWLKKQDV